MYISGKWDITIISTVILKYSRDRVIVERPFEVIFWWYWGDCQSNYCKPMPTKIKCKFKLLLHWHPFSQSFSSLHVTAITEWLILWFPASTESNQIPDIVLFAIYIFYRDATAYPERTVLAACRVLNEDNRLLKFIFDSFSCSIVKDYQPTREQLQASSMTVSQVVGLSDCWIRFRSHSQTILYVFIREPVKMRE